MSRVNPGKSGVTSELTALFNEDVDIASIVQAAANAARLSFQPSYRMTHVEEQDWVRMTQSQFEPDPDIAPPVDRSQLASNTRPRRRQPDTRSRVGFRYG